MVDEAGAALVEASTARRLELLVDAIEEYAIFMVDPQGRVISWNPGAQRMKGYAAQEIIGRDFAVFYDETDRRAGSPARHLREAGRLGSITDEGWRIRLDGSRFWAHVTITALRDAHGVLDGFVKVTRDDTAARCAREREALMEEITAALLAGDVTARVLDRFVTRACRLVAAVGVWLTTVDPFDPDLVRVTASHGPDALPVGSTFRWKESLGAVITDGRAAVVPEFPHASPAFSLLRRRGAALVVPMMSRGMAVGTLVVHMPPAVTVGDADLEVVREFAAAAFLPLAYQQLQDEMRNERIAQDRRRIASDLHDHVIQMVFAAGLGVQNGRTRVFDEEVRAQLDDAVTQLDDAMRWLRMAVFDLQAPGNGMGFRQDLAIVCRRATRALGFSPSVDVQGSAADDLVSSRIGWHALAALREMLSNVARHAGAHTVEVAVTIAESLSIEVTDDGVGPSVSSGHGHGLADLAERAQSMGGRFWLEPGPAGIGSRAVWHVPLTSGSSAGSS